MALEFYDAYINSIAQDPVDYWQELRQASVDDTWSDTSTIRNVDGQVNLGEQLFANESVQVNSVIDIKTGNSLGDDYRKIIYKNYATSANDDMRFLGKYYKFDNFTWLTINTNTIIGSLATAVVQKCNNILKWYDQNGVLQSWACVVDRTLSSTGFDYGSQGVIEANAKTLIKIQLNSSTAKLKINSRIMLNGKTFQIEQVNNHISKTYEELYVFEIEKQANDDGLMNIPNLDGEKPSLVIGNQILPLKTQILLGSTQNFSVYNYVDGEKQNDTFDVIVKNGVQGFNYNLEIKNGNEFAITNLKESDVPIKIVCINKTSGEQVEMNVLLGGRW